jgi:hypothetical protein
MVGKGLPGVVKSEIKMTIASLSLNQTESKARRLPSVNAAVAAAGFWMKDGAAPPLPYALSSSPLTIPTQAIARKIINIKLSLCNVFLFFNELAISGLSVWAADAKEGWQMENLSTPFCRNGLLVRPKQSREELCNVNVKQCVISNRASSLIFGWAIQKKSLVLL